MGKYDITCVDAALPQSDEQGQTPWQTKLMSLSHYMLDILITDSLRD